MSTSTRRGPAPDIQPTEPAGADPQPPADPADADPADAGLADAAAVPSLSGRWTARRLVAASTWAVVGVGVALRLRQWLFARDFWLDELLLLRSIRAQPIDALLDPLPYDQSAPVGWVAVQHLAVGLSDGDERAMRLLPLLFGCAALVVVALLAWTLLGAPAALVATALTAVSPSLIRYSDEFKQYSADVFWVPLMLLFGCRVALRQDGPGDRRAVLLLGGTTAVAVWFSHPAVLTGVGVFGALGLRALVRRRWRELLLLVAASVPFGIGLAVEYVLVLRDNAENAVLQTYWRKTFPAEPLTGDGLLDWVGRRAGSVAENPLGFEGHPAVLLALLLAGLVVLAARRPAALPVLLLPLVVVGAAGITRSYPVSDRLVLFLVPLAALALAAPLDLLPLGARIPRRPARTVALVAAGSLTAATAVGLVVLAGRQVGQTAQAVGRPIEAEEATVAMEYVAARRVDGDLVLVDGRSGWAAAAWYGPRTGLGPYQLMDLRRPGDGCAATWLGAGLRRGDQPGRVWLVYSHVRQDDAPWYEAHLSRFGPQVDRFRVEGAEAVLYDRAAGPPAAAVPPPRARCLRVVDPG